MDALLAKFSSENQNPSNSNPGMYRIKLGFLFSADDAMAQYGEAWTQISRLTMIKGWEKSQCLGAEQTTDLDKAIRNRSVSSLTSRSHRTRSTFVLTSLLSKHLINLKLKLQSL